MKKLLFVILVLIIASSCDKKNSIEEKQWQNFNQKFNVSTVLLSIIDLNGNDLLSPANPNSINLNALRVFFIKNRVSVEYDYQPHLICSDNYPLCQDFFSISDSTLLYFSDSEIDTIFRENNGTIIRYNEKIVYQGKAAEDYFPALTITK